MMKEDLKTGTTTMPGSFQYEGHVKAVGIVEIVFYVLSCIGVLAFTGCILFGGSTSVCNTITTSYYSNTVNTEHFEGRTEATTVSGIIIAVIVIMFLGMIFFAWLVHLVFAGGQQKNAEKLTIWYVIQSVFAAFSVLNMFLRLVATACWLSLAVSVPLFIYRVYSIHVIRCHANEIKAQADVRSSIRSQA